MRLACVAAVLASFGLLFCPLSTASGATIFSDTFDTNYPSYSDLSSNTNWRRTDASNWFTSGGELHSGAGIVDGVLYNSLATTLNSGANDFTASVDVTVNTPLNTAWGGIVVNHSGIPSGAGYVFRISGAGTVQFLPPSGSPLISQANAISGFDASAAYRLEVSSASPNVFDLRIFSGTTLKFESLNVDNTAGTGTASNGVAGVFANATGTDFDNYLISSSVPEPGTLWIISAGVIVIGICRGMRSGTRSRTVGR